MNIKSIKTHPIKKGESIKNVLDNYIKTLNENSILAITSKIISICQGRVMDKDLEIGKDELIKQEADLLLLSEQNPYGIYLTIKNNILIPSAGIDESNGEGVYILYPTNIQEEAYLIWEYLRNKHKLNNVGVIITDSHTTPLRRGVTGITLGWCGFKPLHNYIGKPDIFGQPLRVTQINIIDALATSAVFVMGEGNEQTPIAVIEDAPKIQFSQYPPTKEELMEVTISLEEDIYAPILRSANWIPGKKAKFPK